MISLFKRNRRSEKSEDESGIVKGTRTIARKAGRTAKSIASAGKRTISRGGARKKSSGGGTRKNTTAKKSAARRKSR